MSDVDRQKMIELDLIESGIKAYKKKLAEIKRSGKDMSELKPEARLLQAMVQPLALGIKKLLAKPGRGHKMYLWSIDQLRNLDPDSLAFLTCKFYAGMTSQTRLVTACQGVGGCIEDYANYIILLANAPGYLNKVEEGLSTHQEHRRTVLKFVQGKLHLENINWSKKEKRQIGKVLTSLLVTTSGRFHVVKRCLHQDKHPSHYIVATDDTLEWLAEAHDSCADMHVCLEPMVCKPLDWKGMRGGGFLTQHPKMRQRLMRTSDREKLEAFSGAVDRVANVMNLLQSTRWRINTRVLDVMEQCVGTDLGKLPPMDLKDMLPEPGWANDDEYNRVLKSNPERVRKWKISRALAYDKWYRHSSKRRGLMEQIRIARKYRDEEAIYFCWNVDWRSRVYPMQRWLNPQSDSIGKSLLEFGEGKRIGETGGHWLAVHGCNLFGEDKIPVGDRVKWVNEHLAEILDSADNPLDGRRFWAKADKPFMFLAFCFEWIGYIKNGVDHVTHLPIAMDGSCSGLQHYSAMMRDAEGGSYVNLTPGDRPADVYAEVAKVASKIVERDAAEGRIVTRKSTRYRDENGNELKKPVTETLQVNVQPLAEMWLNKVDRGICKRNVMTLPYGATLRGFIDQLLAELDKLDDKYENDPTIPYESYLNNDDDDAPNNKELAAYLAQVNLTAIAQVVKKPFEVMQWFKTLSKCLSKKNLPFVWESPLGAKFVMNSHQHNIKQIKTQFAGSIIWLSVATSNKNKISASKQSNGVAPNIIHSFDAAHLMTVVERMYAEAGINSFAMIHDSFGTHACDILEMHRILRKSFSDIYSVDWPQRILDNVSEHLDTEEYVELVDTKPAFGDLDLDLFYSYGEYGCPYAFM